jgi:hypothetical protein
VDSVGGDGISASGGDWRGFEGEFLDGREEKVVTVEGARVALPKQIAAHPTVGILLRNGDVSWEAATDIRAVFLSQLTLDE